MGFSGSVKTKGVEGNGGVGICVDMDVDPLFPVP